MIVNIKVVAYENAYNFTKIMIYWEITIILSNFGVVQIKQASAKLADDRFIWAGETSEYETTHNVCVL